MFKEKLRKIKEIESQAVDLLRKAAKQSAETIAEAKESAAEIERLAQSTAVVEAEKVRLSAENEIADETAKIAEISRLKIVQLREGTAAAVSEAAGEIVRRVTERPGT